ncbi:hypothetical protein Holit_02784 [Hollandina sp. SP2]
MVSMIAVEALEEWVITVIIRPRPVPIKVETTPCWETAPINERASGLSRGIDLVRKSRPRNRIPNPKNTSPSILCFHLHVRITKPRPTAGRANTEILKVKPTREMIHPVIVVPILAPMMTPIAWVRVSSPALTKETTITVVAEDDWIIAVTIKPVNTAVTLFPVMKPRTCWNRDPAVCWMPSLITFMPYRNSPRLPMIRNILSRYFMAEASFLGDTLFVR